MDYMQASADVKFLGCSFDGNMLHSGLEPLWLPLMWLGLAVASAALPKAETMLAGFLQRRAWRKWVAQWRAFYNHPRAAVPARFSPWVAACCTPMPSTMWGVGRPRLADTLDNVAWRQQHNATRLRAARAAPLTTAHALGLFVTALAACIILSLCMSCCVVLCCVLLTHMA